MTDKIDAIIQTDFRLFEAGNGEFSVTPSGIEMSAGISHLANLRDEMNVKVDKVGKDREDEVMVFSFSLEDALGAAPAETFGDVVAKLRSSFAQLHRSYTNDFPLSRRRSTQPRLFDFPPGAACPELTDNSDRESPAFGRGFLLPPW